MLWTGRQKSCINGGVLLVCSRVSIFMGGGFEGVVGYAKKNGSFVFNGGPYGVGGADCGLNLLGPALGVCLCGPAVGGSRGDGCFGRVFVPAVEG